MSGAGFSVREPVDLEVDFDPAGRTLRWAPLEGPALEGQKLALPEREVRFRSDGLALVGRLTLPAGEGPHPAIVLVHGSGRDSAVRYYHTGDFFAAHGIATLVYDKRGTGRSEGRYVHDFFALARDVVAAVDWLSAQPEIDAGHIGLSGYSQGGWVAPLAASHSDRVSYVIVNYGMIDSPAEEARIETRNELRSRGVDQASLDQLDEFTRAAVAVVAQDFSGGWDELRAVRRRYADAPWMDQLGGTTVGAFARWPDWVIRLLGPFATIPGLHWYYDSGAVLDQLALPMAWLIAAEDESAPPAYTIAELARLAARGKPFELVVFPATGHGIVEFSVEDGERTPTRYAPDYFRTEVGFARRFSGLDPP